MTPPNLVLNASIQYLNVIQQLKWGFCTSKSVQLNVDVALRTA